MSDLSYAQALARIKETTTRGTKRVIVVVFEAPIELHPTNRPLQYTVTGNIAAKGYPVNLTERQIRDLLAIAARNLDKMRTTQ